jgi:hypothetical protein
MWNSQASVKGHAAARALRPEERRQYKRKPVLWSARIEWSAGAAECIIMDLSLGGAKLRGAAGVKAHDCVTLVIDRFGTIRAEIVWARMGYIGLRFTDSQDQISHILGTTLPL